MKKYKYKIGEVEEEADLEDKDYFLITAIDNLANEIQKMRMSNG